MPMNLSLGLGLGGIPVSEGVGVLLPAPSGFNYPLDLHPLNVRRVGNGHVTDFNAEALMATAFNGVPYYADQSTGSDANSGLSTSLRKRSVSSAVAAFNANGAATGGVIVVRNQGLGIVPRDYGISASGTITPTKPCVIINDGPVNMGTHNLLTWSATSGVPGGYDATRSLVGRVVYLDATDSFGNPVEAVRQANKAAWDAADPGATGVFFPDTSTVYVKLPGGVAPTNDNCLALVSTYNVYLPSSAKDFMLDGIDLWGGHFGSIYANGMTGNVIAKRSTIRYASDPTNLRDAVRMVDVTGLCAFQEVEAFASAKDGFNGTQSTASDMAMLTIECIGQDNGRFTSQSNNGLTLHGTMQGIDVDGQYLDNYGGNVHIINASELWCVGTAARRSKGDASLGGSINPCEFITQHTAQLWRENTFADPTVPNAAALANDTSFIRSRNHTDVSGGNFGAGTFEAF